MKKARIIKRKTSLKSRWTERQTGLKGSTLPLAHPVVKASYLWSILNEQLFDVLGPETHHQFFKHVKPVVILNNVLILEVPNHFSAQWIHTYYHELVDLLLSVLDKKLSSYFVSQSERIKSKNNSKIKSLLESSASQINSKHEE
jgi:chromosomal replication initiation ATPase DnaA